MKPSTRRLVGDTGIARTKPLALTELPYGLTPEDIELFTRAIPGPYFWKITKISQSWHQESECCICRAKPLHTEYTVLLRTESLDGLVRTVHICVERDTCAYRKAVRDD